MANQIKPPFTVRTQNGFVLVEQVAPVLTSREARKFARTLKRAAKVARVSDPASTVEAPAVRR